MSRRRGYPLAAGDEYSVAPQVRYQAACRGRNEPDLTLRSDQHRNVRVGCSIAKQQFNLRMESRRHSPHDLRDILLRMLQADDNREPDSLVHPKLLNRRKARRSTMYAWVAGDCRLRNRNSLRK